MLKANELRIGNFVNDNGEVLRVSKDHFYEDEYTDGMKGVKPIPLTEEWLIKLGFEKSGLYFVKDQVYIDEGVNFSYKYNYAEREILYVHQLQNLYFALTGEELTVK